jgi:WD40 repeat protein
VITASLDGTARIWDASTGAMLAIFHHPAKVSYAAFSPDGKRVVLGGYDGAAVIHELPQLVASTSDLAQLLYCRIRHEVQGDVLVPRRRDEQACWRARR